MIRVKADRTAQEHQFQCKFGKTLKDIRLEKGLTLRELSKTSGISVSYLSDIERGVTLPSIWTLNILSAALGHTLTIEFSDDYS
jgi:transcriptional regulator with XRE-family HTH domain